MGTDFKHVACRTNIASNIALAKGTSAPCSPAARIDDAACVAIAGSVNLDVSSYRTSLGDPAMRQRVAEDARRAAARGAFGVPTFFAGQRMFWGNDRLVLLEHWLKQGE